MVNSMIATIPKGGRGSVIVRMTLVEGQNVSGVGNTVQTKRPRCKAPFNPDEESVAYERFDMTALSSVLLARTVQMRYKRLRAVPSDMV